MMILICVIELNGIFMEKLKYFNVLLIMISSIIKEQYQYDIQNALFQTREVG